MPRKFEAMTRAMARRTVRLLDMEYKPSEIADELACKIEWVKLAIEKGCPVRKDKSGRYWIHGESFARWANNYAPQKAGDKYTMSQGEAYCVACKKVTAYTETARRANVSYGECPAGHKVTRFIAKGKDQP